MEGKTKAVALDRQCGFWNRRTKPSLNHTRAHAGGQSLSSPERASTKSLSFELPRLGEKPVVQICNSMQIVLNGALPKFWVTDNSLFLWQSVKLRSAHNPLNNKQSSNLSFAPKALIPFPRVQKCTLLLNQRHNHTAESGEAFKYGIFPPLKTTDLWRRYKSSSGQTPYPASGSKNQPFGSIPRCCSSLRMMRLIQADTDASPSWAKACLIPSSKLGSTRNAICLLPLPLISMVDIWLTPDYFEVVSKCMTGEYQKATPRTVGPVPRRLTKPLSEVTIMAELQHTQTRPEFTWRFLGKYSASKDMRRIVVHIIATSEAEARSCLPLWDLVFAARLPANHLEVLRHA